MLEAKVIHDVVCKLIGDIEPEGDSAYDYQRKLHLMNLIDLINMLLDDIDDVASMNGSLGLSADIIMKARGAMVDWAKWLTERSEEL